MLKIKLARFGKRNQPHYRIVVNEARDKRDGSYVALLGHYAPTQTPKVLEIDVTAYQEWLIKGAQPTETVAGLFARYQSGNPFPAKPQKPSKKARTKAAAAAESTTEAAPETALTPDETSDANETTPDDSNADQTIADSSQSEPDAAQKEEKEAASEVSEENKQDESSKVNPAADETQVQDTAQATVAETDKTDNKAETEEIKK